jgi:hypothetical protein
MSKLKPSVDLGYPTEAYGRIPAFNSIEEEAEFWDTHDTSQFYGVELQPVDVKVSPKLRSRFTVSLEMKGRDLDKLIQIARMKGIDPAELVRDWLEERLHQESEVAAARR